MGLSAARSSIGSMRAARPRSSPIACAPRSSNSAITASSARLTPIHSYAWCLYLDTRPIQSISLTAPSCLNPSSARSTSMSSSSVSGSRLFFWLQPATMAFTDMG